MGPIKAVAGLIKGEPIQIETEQANLINKKINLKADETTSQTLIVATSWNPPNLSEWKLFMAF